MGKQFIKRGYRYWTEPEIEMLRNGQIPAGRTYSQCCSKADAMGIPKPAFPELTSGRTRWTPEEIDALKNGKVPPGRTVSACVARGYGLGLRVVDLGDGTIRVESVKEVAPSTRKMLDRAECLARMHAEGLTYLQIAENLGVSRQYVHEMVQKYWQNTSPTNSSKK